MMTGGHCIVCRPACARLLSGNLQPWLTSVVLIFQNDSMHRSERSECLLSMHANMFGSAKVAQLNCQSGMLAFRHAVLIHLCKNAFLRKGNMFLLFCSLPHRWGDQGCASMP